MLITLTIIGVVAAMTVPLLTANHKKIEVAAKLKKFYQTMTNAYETAELDYDVSSSKFQITGSTSKEYFEKYLAPYIKYTKIEDESGQICSYFNYSTIVYLDDGTKMYLQRFSDDPYLRVLYDINGDKNPNQLGRDLFEFWNGFGRDKFTPYWPWTSDEYQTRDRIRTMCSQAHNHYRGCSKLIMIDGWEIKDDYPIKI